MYTMYRMTFGELADDEYQSDMGATRGNIGKGGIGGSIRMAQVPYRGTVLYLLSAVPIYRYRYHTV